MTTTAPARESRLDHVRGAMYAGLALTVLAALAPLIDIATVDTIGDHVRDAYPRWPDSTVATERNAIAGYLAAVWLIGVAGWILTMRAVAGRRRSARRIAVTMFTLGTLVALTNLSIPGGEYERIVPPAHGALGLLPVAVGLAVTVMVLRRIPSR
ncbi:hypothetical protein [Jiangella asiatica]|uniref:Uncharacterized protein n=1 Tax=Jiangella asiatica TaxID=2530372 RepID=A0A4R5DBW0_9ACTN|nr:hypothetical protein [Jiangella asiatica]TDE11196.1 hypothetical protein E1269_10015 [Jiangella asiatica]